MSLPQILLRQRYFLSFFTTTLLISLTPQSSLAFSLIPTVNPGDTEASYTLPDQRKGITTWNPLDFKIIPRGGTVGFLEKLGQDFNGWTFNPAPNDLAGNFRVTEYIALATPTYPVGARLQLQYEPSNGDPTPANNSLHWIQRVWDNHSLATDVHGDNENLIDIGAGVNTPFYDTPTLAEIISGQILEEGMFRDTASRLDRDRDHNWLAELYLVDSPAPNQVTIYNGIQWGWQNRVESVPEPLTLFASGVSLGFGVLLKKTHKETKENKKNNLL